MQSYEIFFEKIGRKFARIKKCPYLCNAFEARRALSSAGSERLPYKQRVGGSNPSAPTTLPHATRFGPGEGEATKWIASLSVEGH